MVQNYSALQLSDLHALKDYLAERVNIFVYGSGVAIPVGDTRIPALGVPWFLIALFFGRTLFDYMHLKLKKNVFIIAVCLASIIGLCFGIIQWLPFSFDIALAIQPFFALGVWMKKIPLERNTGKICIGSLGVWAGTFIIIGLISHTYLELAVRRYPLFPLCFLCAAAGTMFFSSFSHLLCSKHLFASPLKYLGKYSMVMLWIHCFDSLYSFAYNITDNGYINISLRVLENIAVFVIVMFFYHFFKTCILTRIKYNRAG